MKHILMLSTGGTIAATPTDGGLTPTVTGEYMVELIPELRGLCQISCQELLCIDSSNMQPENWVTMAEAVAEHYEKYDGFVITHGTDTMAYSASALSHMLKNLGKPVVLTGSQIPIEDPETDGKRNILNAFRTAADSHFMGVFIVFDSLVISGLYGKKLYTHSFHGFASINHQPAATIENGQLVPAELPPVPQGDFECLPYFDDSVLLVKLVPGTKPVLLETAPAMGYKGVVIEAFGLGGIPNIGRNLLPAISNLVAQNIPVAVVTQCVYEGCDLSVYDIGVEAASAGVLCGGMMTAEAAVTKLMWILGQTTDLEQIKALF